MKFFAAVAAIFLLTNAAETSNLPPPIAAALNSNAANKSAAFAIPFAYASTYATFYDLPSAYEAESLNDQSINSSDVTFHFADLDSSTTLLPFDNFINNSLPYDDTDMSLHLDFDNILSTEPKSSCPSSPVLLLSPLILSSRKRHFRRS